ncbi:TPA: alcohol dehydrogenase, partial [Candidatus Poribacteria bacterium]|nr:alcohol dehydrogenase [Candidatus Poribacteria bacterium]
MTTTLDTGISNARNVNRYLFGSGTIGQLTTLLSERRKKKEKQVVYLVDEYFETNSSALGMLSPESNDQLIYISTRDEPTTQSIDQLTETITGSSGKEICAVVGIGGGITLDTAKAVSNLLTNGG